MTGSFRNNGQKLSDHICIYTRVRKDKTEGVDRDKDGETTWKKTWGKQLEREN